MKNPSDRSNDAEMHREVEWLRPSDRRIVQELSKYDGWQKTDSLTLNLPYSGQHVARRCLELAKRGLIERYDESTPAYRANDLSTAFLADEMTPEDLDNLVESDLDELEYPERDSDD